MNFALYERSTCPAIRSYRYFREIWTTRLPRDIPLIFLVVLILLLLFILLLPADSRSQNYKSHKSEVQEAPEPPLHAEKTVVTREMLDASSVTRLSDLFAFANDWYYLSINGFDAFASPAGLSGWKRPLWKIIVDGQEFDLNFMDFQSLNLLPVNLGDIDNVEFISNPGHVNGLYAIGGIMNITTRKPDKQGLSARGRIMAGNEINDPGPYEYTELRTPNEERTGPDYELSLDYTTDNLMLRGGIRYQEHKSTDTPIDRRIKLMRVAGDGIYHDAINRGSTSWFEAGYSHGRFRHKLVATLTNIHDFYYFYPIGREIPSLWSFYHLGYLGNHQITDRHTLRIQSARNARSGAYKQNRFRLDWNTPLQTSRNRLVFDFHSDSFRYSAGASHTIYAFGDGLFTQNESHHVLDFFSDGQLALTRTWQIRVWAGFQSEFNSIGYRLGISNRYRLAPNMYLTGRIAWHDLPRRGQPDIWHWSELGGADSPGNLSSRIIRPFTDIPENREPGNDRLLYGSLGLAARISHQIHLASSFSLARHKHFFQSRHSYVMDEFHQWFEQSAITFSDHLSPVVAGISLKLQARISDVFRHHIAYRFQKDISANQVPGEFHLFPEHKATFNNIWTPVPGLDVWISARAQSAVRWHEYEQIDGVEYTEINELVFYNYSATTEPFIHLDAAVSKTLWNERLRISFRGTNLLNQGYVLHPVGLDHDLTFYAQLKLLL